MDTRNERLGECRVQGIELWRRPGHVHTGIVRFWIQQVKTYEARATIRRHETKVANFE